MSDTVEHMREGAPVVLPTGTVTLLLGDVEGSTRAWERDPERTRRAFAELDETVDSSVAGHGGVRPVEQGEGDSFVAAFPTASDALACAIEIQRRLVATTLRVRIAVHTGEVHLRDEGNYVGPALNRAARLRDAAHGGQIVLSQVAHELVADGLSSDVSLRDLGSHRLKDLGRPEHVFQVVDPLLPSDFPPLRSLDHVPNNLPVQLTSFVGREAELSVLQKVLGDARLLTLTGAGGSGKTRLALELAARVLADRNDGAWFVDLAPVSDPHAVPSAVASAMGSSGQTGRRMVDVLLDQLRTTDAVLVLDNCEHVVEAAAALVEALLLGCPALTIVATSREPLGVRGETPWLVPSLSVPPQTSFSRADIVRQYEAVQLFVERARKARPELEIDDEAASAIAAISQRVDGIPLAIELAAARARVLSPVQILEGLDDCFRLLKGGARTSVPRHQTLRASVDWSYKLLSDEERATLNRLSVFAGGFALDAAEAVAGTDPLAPADVLDLLQSLVDKSLLSVDVAAPTARYRMLETIRQYACERLAASGDENEVRDRHRAFYLERAEEAGPRLETADLSVWADYLDVERENLRSAFSWAESRGDGETLLRLVAALYWFWVVRGHLGEGRRLYKRAFELRGDVAAGVVAAAFAGAAHISLLRFDPESEAFAREALDAARAAGDRRIEGRARYLLGWAEGWDDFETSIRDLRAGVAATRETGDRWGLLMALVVLGTFHERVDLDERMEALDEALAVADELDEHYIANSARYSLARPLIAVGRTAEAEQLLRTVVDHARGTRDTYSLTMALPDLGWLRAMQGDVDEGLRLVEESASLFRTMHLPWLSQEVQCEGSLHSVLAMAERHEEALAAADRAIAASRRLGLPDILALSLSGLALSEQAVGDVGAARGHADETLAVLAATPPTRTSSWAVASAKLSLARLLWSQGDGARAERLAHDALAMSVELGCHFLMRGTVYALESLALIGDDAAYATRLLGAVDALLAGAGHVRSPDRRGDYDAAVDRLRRELGDDGFDAAYAAGGRLSLEEAVEYAQRGRGRRGRPRSGWDALTPTELEVAKLVAEGLSNPQIAERMFVSRKTVTTHLSHVFAKLGISSRAALSAEVIRRGMQTEGET